MAFDSAAHIAESPWLSRMPQALASALLQAATLKKYETGAYAYHLGDPPGGIFGIVSGVVSILTEDDEKAIVIGQLLGPGHWFGENALLSGTSRKVAAMVKSPDAELLQVSPKAFAALAAESPDFWRALAGLSAMNSNIAIQAVRDLMLRSPRERCLAVLNRLASSVGKDQWLPVSQDELATICALSRGTVSRMLTALEAEGRIKRGYRAVQLVGPAG